MTCWLFHKWGNWQRYEIHHPARRISAKYELAPAIEYGQVRLCLRCNKMSEREMDRIVTKEEQ